MSEQRVDSAQDAESLTEEARETFGLGSSIAIIRTLIAYIFNRDSLANAAVTGMPGGLSKPIAYLIGSMAVFTATIAFFGKDQAGVEGRLAVVFDLLLPYYAFFVAVIPYAMLLHRLLGSRTRSSAVTTRVICYSAGSTLLLTAMATPLSSNADPWLAAVLFNAYGAFYRQHRILSRTHGITYGRYILSHTGAASLASIPVIAFLTVIVIGLQVIGWLPR